MTQSAVKKNRNVPSKTFILTILLIMLVIVVGWHVLLPLLGLSLIITGSIWGVAVATIVLICIAALLCFIFTGIGIFILGMFVFAWSVLAIILFPLLFPALIPLLFLLLVIGLISHRKKNK